MLTIAVLALLTIFLLRKSTELPGMALVGLLSMFTIEQWAQSQSAYFLERSAIVNFLFAAIAAYALALRIYRRELRTEPFPVAGGLVIALYLYALFSTTWSSAGEAEIRQAWFNTAPYIAVQILIAPLLVARPKDLTKICSHQIFVGGLFCTLIIFGAEYVGRRIVLGEDGSASGNPLAVAETGGITIICAVMMMRLFKGDILVKLLISGLCLIAIVKSGSRGQLFSLVAALIVAFPLTYSIRNPKIVVGSTIVAIILAVVAIMGLDEFWSQSGRFTTGGMESDYHIRIERVSRLLDAWLADPLAIVVGLGNSASYDFSIIGHYAHIVPIEIMCEEGLLGAFVYLSLLWFVGRDARYVLRRKESTREETAGLAILFGIVVYMFMLSLKQGSLLTTSSFFMAIMLFTRAVAMLRREDRLERVAASPAAGKRPHRDYTIYARQSDSAVH